MASLARFILSASAPLLFIHRSTSSLFSFFTLSLSFSAMESCRLSVIISSCMFWHVPSASSRYSPPETPEKERGGSKHTAESFLCSLNSWSLSLNFVKTFCLSAVMSLRFLASSLFAALALSRSVSAVFARASKCAFDRSASAKSRWS